MHPKDEMQGWTLPEISSLLREYVYITEETSGGGQVVAIGQVRKVTQSIDDEFPKMFIGVPHRDWVEVYLTPDCVIKVLEID